MRPVLLAVLAAASGCLTPRSLMVGQMASATGEGGVEVGASAGVGYALQAQPPVLSPLANGDTLISQEVRSTFLLPAVEGNAHIGLTERLGFNAHFSSAGIQPGLKVTLNRSRRANVALMPQIALGYGAFRQASYVSGPNGVQMEAAPTATTLLTFMAGLKLFISHHGGFYTALGYDFILTRSVTTVTTGLPGQETTNATLSTSMQHAGTFNVGFSFAAGWLRVRPEVAVAIIPLLSTGLDDGNRRTFASGGWGFAILPGLSLVAVTPRAAREPQEEPASEPEQDEATSESQE
jgi:hypothetical protein